MLAIRARPPERRWHIWLVLALAAASHGLLDALTNGGRGVAFFAPFVDTRWHFPVQPIEVSPIGVWSFFSRRGFEVLTNEVVWLWVPCLVALAATWAHAAGQRSTNARSSRARSLTSGCCTARSSSGRDRAGSPPRTRLNAAL